MTAVEVVVTDGGRAVAGYRGSTRDCVTRAIAVATGLPYQEVYDELQARQKAANARRRKKYRQTRAGAGTGVLRTAYEPYLLGLGFEWVPVMGIGKGTTMHVRTDELPDGTVVLALSRHMAASIDRVVHDSHDPSRGGTRCVYGYYRKP